MSAGSTGQTDPDRLSRGSSLLEMTLALVLGYCCHLYYNPVGHLTSLQGRDLAPWITTALDRLIPFQPLWVLFYQLAYFMPAVVLAAVLLRGQAQLAAVRRALAAFVSLLATHYVLYLALPVSARALRVPMARLGPGWAERLVAYQYQIATAWNALPSLHVSACWYFFRLLGRYLPRARLAYLLWFAGMLVGTVAIKIHLVLDGVTGLLLGEAVYRLFDLLSRRGRLSGRWSSTPRMAALYLAAIAVALSGLVTLVKVSGYEGTLYIVTGRAAE